MQKQTSVGFIFPTVCAVHAIQGRHRVLRSSCDPTADFGMEHGQGGTKTKRDVTLYSYMGCQSKKHNHGPQFVVRSLFCYTVLPSLSKGVSRNLIP